MAESERPTDGVSRRTMLKRIGAAGAIAWVTPVISSLTTPAHAATSFVTCGHTCIHCESNADLCGQAGPFNQCFCSPRLDNASDCFCGEEVSCAATHACADGQRLRRPGIGLALRERLRLWWRLLLHPAVRDLKGQHQWCGGQGCDDRRTHRLTVRPLFTDTLDFRSVTSTMPWAP